MPTGTVKFYNEHKGYGFIQPDEGGNDAFVHISAVERAGFRSLRQDQRLTYELEEDQRGKLKAVRLASADEAPQAQNDEPAEQPESAESAQPDEQTQ